jgi:CBS domain-containing protein
MSPRSISEPVVREPPLLRASDSVETAVRRILESGLPALPVVDERDRFVGIFGEREFMGALFPGYLNDLRSAAFLRRSLDEVLEKRDACRRETVTRHMTTDHVDVGPDHSDLQVAEIFLHHRVLVVPVLEAGRVVGLIPRREFFRTLADRFLQRGGNG